MTYSSYSVKIPGKLMIAGEYAVLEPKQKSVVIAVDRYVTAYIEPDKKNQISIPQWKIEGITWEMNDERIQFGVSDSRLKFIQNSITVAIRFLQEKSVKLQPFKIQIKSELNDPLTGKKYGLGSSAAIVVAVISAVLRYHTEEGEYPIKEQIFKLSAIAHLKTQGNGSGADIAAAVYGGWLEYTAFSSEWILNELEEGKGIIELIYTSWPNLVIKSLTPPSSLELVVGWTKEAAATAPMIKRVKNFRDSNIDDYNGFLRESYISVEQLINSFEKNDCKEAINSLAQNRKTLQKLDEMTGITIETAELKTLCDIAEAFGSGKSSGAGGGDCGIAFLKSDNQKEELYRAWKAVNISPLNLSISKKGISIVKET
ncbi:phosphomevalonate kinase [Clostridium sp. D2Q-11]|uniref:phosphomevalonate kinase n=1 Tax=Anaeromonas frigoriresistens TaxID=2683708 RepID=A0A942Z7X6_9FIRM|nr:phosphomevalonate kinase [Anaeromonas frigoriresistens]MBS4537369.1 phosphomevalonate kinase [Anaeromonas frigoriresistens]